MRTWRREWVVAVAATVVVAAALVVWLLPRGPEGVAVGTLESPASYGEEFRVVSDGGDVWVGSILGMTEFPSTLEGERCFVVVGVVRLAQGEAQKGNFGGVFLSAMTSDGRFRTGSSTCPSDGAYSGIDQLVPYGLSSSASGDVGRYQLFYDNVALSAGEDPVGLVVSATVLAGATALDPSASIYEFRVTQTLGIHGAT